VKGKQKDAIIDEAGKVLKIVSDYWSEPTLDSIERWLDQFDEEVRLKLISEMRHILSKSYLSKDAVQEFLKGLISAPKLVGANAASFWRRANFFRSQKGGDSQHELLELFDGILEQECGFGLAGCASDDGPVIYIDDILLSGNRLVNDLRDWIPEEAPNDCILHAIFVGVHSGGSYYADKSLREMGLNAGKKIEPKLWRVLSLENFSNSGASADVYRLRKLPDDEETARYIHEHVKGDPALMRPEKESNKSTFFSSEENRNLLEQVFWSAGLGIRDIAPDLKETHRPLGYTSINSNNKLGFGSLVLTYRNCPNNCPLAYWVGDPWHPLFPRKTN
jgi:hypothetical protein